MTSFIDLMKSDVWSEADIVNRTEAMVRTEFSAVSEAILSRKITGAGLGQYTLTEAEMGELQGFAVATESARLAGAAARADMALLLEVMALEAAHERLKRTEVVAEITPAVAATATSAAVPKAVSNQPAVDQDRLERAAAQSVVDLASAALANLYVLRNPPVMVAVVDASVVVDGAAPVEPA